MPKFNHVQWNYTRAFKDSHGEDYQGRRIIGRDTPIKGGVYYGRYGGEAIVVDPHKNPDYYDGWYDLAEAAAMNKSGTVQPTKILRAVYDTVYDLMPYSKAGVDKVNARIAQRHGDAALRDGTKVELESYMSSNVGVCRHQALIAGVLLETFIEQGEIGGQVSVDRNIVWKPNGERGGHAWARYSDEQGQVTILDIAQNYLGSLESSHSFAQWNYFRPEEARERGAPLLGSVTTPLYAALELTPDQAL